MGIFSQFIFNDPRNPYFPTGQLTVVSKRERGVVETNPLLGSPSVSVSGRDIEHGAEEKTDDSLSCRMYDDPRDWLVDALAGQA